LILVATKNEARRLSHKLRPGLRYDVRVGTGSTQYRSTNRVVATIASGQIYDDAWDIIIYAFAEQLAGMKVLKAALETAGPRVYGMVKSGHPLPLQTQLIVEGVCGPVIYETPDPRGREADVHVMTLQAPWMPAPGKLTALERKRRRMYWHNDERNAAIADVAEAFAAGDEESLWNHGLFFDDDVDPVIEDNSGPRVAIVVESPEHGRVVVDRLPGWQLLDGVVQRTDKGAGDVLDRVVITLVRLSQLRQIDCDVLVWAVGGRSCVDMKGFPPRSKDGRHREILIVDVTDDFDDMAVDEAADRQQWYHDRGWRVDDPKNARRVAEDLRSPDQNANALRENTITAPSQPDVPTGINTTPTTRRMHVRHSLWSTIRL